MKVKVIDEIITNEVKIGDIFIVDGHAYCLVEKDFGVILRDIDRQSFGCNGVHPHIESLVQNLVEWDMDYKIYSQNDYELQLVKKEVK